MAKKQNTTTQLNQLVTKLNDFDFNEINFDKLPEGYETSTEFVDKITKTLNASRNKLKSAQKSFTTNQTAEVFGSLLNQILVEFDGDRDRALSYAKEKLTGESVKESVQKTEVTKHVEEQSVAEYEPVFEDDFELESATSEVPKPQFQPEKVSKAEDTQSNVSRYFEGL